MQLPDSNSPVAPPAPEISAPPLRPPEEPPWDLVDVFLTAGFAFIAFNLLAALAVGIAHTMRRFHGIPVQDLLGNALIAVPVQMIAYLLIVGFMVQIVRFRYDKDLMAVIGWNFPERKTAVNALGGGLGLAIVSQLLAGLLSKWTPTSLPIERLFQQPTSAYVVSFFAVLVAPIVEELFFRGFLYPALARPAGRGGAIWLTALAFTALHGSQLGYAWAALAPILLVGLVLTIIRAVTHSLAQSVLVHMAYNGTLLGATLISTHGFHRLPHS